MKVWSVGEVLWDVFPDQERFGGAALNFCANLQRMGDEATLISAVGNDERGFLALQQMAALGLSTRHVLQVPGASTGVAIISTSERGEPSFVIPRPAAFDEICTDTALIYEFQTESQTEALAANFDWLYFGTLLQTAPAIESFTTSLSQHLPSTRCFYDMNLRAGHWDLPLVQRLSALTSVLKLNESEAEMLFTLTHPRGAIYAVEEFCRFWAETYAIDTVCVTLGSAGCLVYHNDEVCRVAGYTVKVCDTVGSGDAFAAAFLHGHHQGWSLQHTARFANAAGALVASRAGATPPWTMEECLGLMQTANDEQ